MKGEGQNALIRRLGGLEISFGRFVFLFPILLYGICNALNSNKLVKWFYGADGLDGWALSAYLLAGLGLFISFFALFTHRWTVKPIAILLVVASATATYFISKYDVAIDSSMIMNAIHTDPAEVRQLLSLQMIPYIAFLIVIPITLICATHIVFPPRAKYLLTSLRIIGISMSVALISVYSNYNAIHRAGNISNKYILYSLVPINILSGSISSASKSLKPYLQSEKSETQISGVVSAPGNLVVVLAIGESARRKSFSLYGYDRRNTNPLLQDIGGLHLLNGIAKRGSTLYALPEILARDDIMLTTMTSKLGIPTSCYVNYTLYETCAEVGETKVENCSHGGKCYDEDTIPLLEANLRSYVSGYRFVVMHLGGGSHGPTYADRHPPEFLQFKPTCEDADVANQCTREQLYNSYDNTILYVDYVLRRTIEVLEKSTVPYVFVYLSDHGESLMEDGRMFHGMPPGVPLPAEQSQIPIIVKSSIPISIPKRDAYRQQDVFGTVLDLFSIQTSMFDRSGGFVRKGTSSVGIDAE